MNLLILYLISVILNLALLFFKIVPQKFFNDSEDAYIIAAGILIPGVTHIVTVILIVYIIAEKIKGLYNIK